MGGGGGGGGPQRQEDQLPREMGCPGGESLLWALVSWFPAHKMRTHIAGSQENVKPRPAPRICGWKLLHFHQHCLGGRVPLGAIPGPPAGLQLSQTHQHHQGILPSSWPSWILQAQLPEHPPTPPHRRPQHTSSLMSDKQPTPPPNQPPWCGAEPGTGDTFPQGQRDFSLPRIDFGLPPSPISHGGRGRYKGKPPRERNPKLQTGPRPSLASLGGWGQGIRTACLGRVWSTDPDKWVLRL